MKELSIEEKSRRYDEAIEKFDVILNLNTVKKSGTIFADDVRKIFPELKESEDELMIQYFKDLAPFDKADELYEKYGFSHKDAIAWLEKQGEHANFLSKIQAGDKVTRNEDGVLVNLSQLNRVANKQGEQKHAAWSKEDEKQARQIERIVHDGCTQKLQKQIADWFESLKERYTWKPSEEQMNTLEYYMHTLVCNEHKEVLFGLYADLKKLMEK